MAERINAFEWLMRSSQSDDIQGSNDNNFQIGDPDPETTEFINEQHEESLMTTEEIEEDHTTNQRLIYSLNFFNKINNNQSMCNTCKKVLKKPSSTTTTLVRHLRIQTKKYSEYQTYSFNSKSYLSQNSARAKLITQNINEMIALDYQPYSIVKDRGFKNLTYTLESKYKLPTRQYLASTAIPQLYSKKLSLLKEEINTELNSMQSISFTFDIWTSGAQQPYISLTTHYLTKQFELRNKTLGCSYFLGEHDGKSIFLKIKSMVSEWNIDILSLNIPIYMVTDNARNISCALNKYNSNDNLHHYFCAAHTLQLAIQDALKENNIESLLKKFRPIVTHYNHSNKSWERLQQIQVRLNLPNHKLIQMVETRWNSVFLMLERIIEQKEAIVLDL
ncbi:zinc finger BED domain-containing protein 4-like [Metopolophium dirhodum]|uniref:zinc finger BED domain-containing protein 4-like n=1 Tax=Metopolophium dirhodum TaxID=44670 RepID=UPI002990354A|nr:zinc finger BED domain-containing protein 4-like [Metopolophium dirhodum]